MGEKLSKQEIREATARVDRGYEDAATVHDHFDGSLLCVQCKGPCRLPAAEMAYTALVREIFESEHNYHTRMPPGVENLLRKRIPDFVRFLQRAHRVHMSHCKR